MRTVGDLSFWVKTANAILRALLYEEIYFCIMALRFWTKSLRDFPQAMLLLEQFTRDLDSILDKVLLYLELVKGMDVERLSQIVMVLLGMMQKKEHDQNQSDNIEDKDIAALSEFMENLNLEEFGSCVSWDVCPSAEVKKMHHFLLEIFGENKEDVERMVKQAQSLKKTLSALPL